LTTDGTAESWGTVTTPVVWTQRQNGLTETFNSLATNGTTIYVAAGSNGILYSSTNSGVTWTSRTSQFGTSQITNVAYGNGVFVAVGSAGKISTSTDGITWTARTANMATNEIAAVAYANGLFVAVGDGANAGTGGITTSSDGTTWTKRNTPGTTNSARLFSVNYGNGYWVAVGQANNTTGYYSTDGATWTALPASLTGTRYYVNYIDSKWIVMSNGGTGSMSTNSSLPTGTWTTYSSTVPHTETPNTNNLGNQISIYGGKIYFLPGVSDIGSQFINVTGSTYVAANGSGLEPRYAPIPYPTYNTTATGGLNPYAITINNTGGIVIAISTGRIYTSF
jgi:hypothetical protein